MKFNKKQTSIGWIVLFLLCIVLLSSLVLWGIHYFGGIERCVAYITELAERNSVGAFFLFVGVQILQVLISVIPGEPVEVLAGVLYGTVGGTLVCLLGIFIGNVIIFYLVRRFGVKLILKLTHKKDISEFQFLARFSNLDYVIFILFLIPGTPKDMLIYAAALTPIPLVKFLVLTGIARLPSIVSSTFAGTHLGSGNYGLSLLVFLAIALIGFCGIYLQPKIMKKLQQKEQGGKEDS